MKRIVALFVMVQCGVVLAANETPAEKRANEPIKFGVSVGAEYTDNRDALPEKESNVDLYITPCLILDMKWEATVLSLSYAPTFRYRTNPSIIDNDSQLFHNFVFGFAHDLKNLKLRVSENFNLTDDPSVQQNGSTLRRDSSFMLSQTEVGMTYAFSRLSNVDILGRYMVKTYDDASVATESDQDKTDAGITLWHQPGKRFALIGMASYSKFGYEEYLGVDRGFDSVYLGAGVEQVFSPNFRCGIRGGIQNVTYADNSMESESSPYGTISAQVSTVPSTRITASVSHMIREAFIFPFSSQKSTEFGLRLDWDAPVPELRFGLSGSYRMGDYNADNVPSALLSRYLTDPVLRAYADAYGENPSGKENSFVVAGEVAFQIGLGTKIKFVQSYENVDSDVRWSFNRNASSLVLTREF